MSYRPDRAAWTNRAHLAAVERIYPRVWPQSRFKFESVLNSSLDYELGVDYIAHVQGPFRDPLRFYIQERFRDPDRAAGYTDITVTETNTDTGNLAELHKLTAHLFVYGIYHENTQIFTRLMVVYADHMLQALATRRLSFTRIPDNGKGQSFIGITMSALVNAHCVELFLPTADDLITFEQLPDGQLRIVFDD